MTYDANAKPGQREKAPPGYCEQVRQLVTAAADASKTLATCMANLPAEAPWPLPLAWKAEVAQVEAAAVLSLYSRSAAGQLPVSGDLTAPTATYLISFTALSELARGVLTLTQAVADLKRAEETGRLTVSDADRRWLAVLLHRAAQLVRGEAERATRVLGQAGVQESSTFDLSDVPAALLQRPAEV
jgi:hypothetical protein